MALRLAAAQLRDDLTGRVRHRLLVDVLGVDVEAAADWLDSRAWLLSVDPAALDQLLGVVDLAQRRVDVDDELVALDDAPAVQLAGPQLAVPVGGHAPGTCRLCDQL